MDNQTTVEQLKEIVFKFCQERGWDRMNNPKDQTMDIVSEATELMDIFLYRTEQQMSDRLKNDREQIENEVADIAFALLNFCSSHNIDLSKALEHKIALTAKKYPVK